MITREDAKLAVGPGWSHLIDQLYVGIVCGNVEVVQIKEKFGELQISVVGNLDKYTYGYIHAIEDMSSRICEQCGRPGECRDIGGWLKTLCEKCTMMVQDKEER